MNNIPTLQTLYLQRLADLESQMNITIPLFGKSFLRALAMVLAGKDWLLYLRLAVVQKNVWVDTADSVANGGTLERFGFVKMGRYPFPATQGKYLCSVIAEDGAVIQGGTQFTSNDDSLNPNMLFVLDVTYVCNGYLDEIELRALESGDGSALQIGNQLTSTIPISLVERVVTVVAENEQPQAAEDLEDYRQKVIASFRLLPQGGAASDYRLWSVEVSGIVNAYPYAASGQTSEVNLFLEADTIDGIPTSQDLQNVEDNIELPTDTQPARKPITHIVNYLPIVPRIIDIEIADFAAITPTLEALIEDAVIAALAEIRPFVGAIDIASDRKDYFDTNTVVSIILQAQPGSVFGAVTMTVDSNPETSFTFENGDIPQLGTITYV